MGYFWQKLTVWEKYPIEDSLLEDADFNSQEDFDIILDAVYNEEPELDYNTFETMPLGENSGFSTIEIYNSNGDLVYQNGKEIKEEN